jgi:hypothetical protein
METPQRPALLVTVDEASHTMRRVEKSSFLRDQGVTVYTVPSETPIYVDERKVPAVVLMVRAETDYLVGVGVGFVTLLVEGLR